MLRGADAARGPRDFPNSARAHYLHLDGNGGRAGTGDLEKDGSRVRDAGRGYNGCAHNVSKLSCADQSRRSRHRKGTAAQPRRQDERVVGHPHHAGPFSAAPFCRSSSTARA